MDEPHPPTHTFLLQLLGEYHNFFAQGRSDSVRHSPCLAEVPSRVRLHRQLNSHASGTRFLMFLQLFALATWKRFKPTHHLKR